MAFDTDPNTLWDSDITNVDCQEIGSYIAGADPFVCQAPGGVPFAFNSMWRSPVTGLVYMRNRVYSPRLGQFLSHDPLGYQFASFDPINKWDPLGLMGSDVRNYLYRMVPSTYEIEARIEEASGFVLGVANELAMEAKSTLIAAARGNNVSAAVEAASGDIRPIPEAKPVEALTPDEHDSAAKKSGFEKGKDAAPYVAIGVAIATGGRSGGSKGVKPLADSVTKGVRKNADAVAPKAKGPSPEQIVPDRMVEQPFAGKQSPGPSNGAGGSTTKIADEARETNAKAADSVAAEVTPRVANAANHVFGQKSLEKHNLDVVLDAFGGDSVVAFNALESAAQTLANNGTIKGVFETTVEIAGETVTVRGAVVKGVVRVGTAYIP